MRTSTALVEGSAYLRARESSELRGQSRGERDVRRGISLKDKTTQKAMSLEIAFGQLANRIAEIKATIGDSLSTVLIAP